MSISRIICYLSVALSGSLLEAGDLPVESVYIRLDEDISVPARAAGVFVDVVAKEGQSVKAGAILAQLDDKEQKLEYDRKRLDLLIAKRQAENRVPLEYAQKAVEIAKEQLSRAEQSRQNLPKSVSLKELEDFRLASERAALEVNKSSYELEIAELNHRVKESELAFAELQFERRKIASPISGIVSKIERQRGEWVQPGEAVFRIVRLDVLRAEGFVGAREAISGIEGAAVTVTVEQAPGHAVKYLGKLVFVDPDVEPTNQQVRIRAEIANHDMRLRPGMPATMTIHRPDTPASQPGKPDDPAASAP